jgi:hypothetical protein
MELLLDPDAGPAARSRRAKQCEELVGQVDVVARAIGLRSAAAALRT